MLKYSRNLCLYPNVYIMDQFGSQIRHFNPVAVDQTEVTIYCIAPKGESAEARKARIRQYEDFFNASGMATPDDLEEFRSCQKTYLATASPWNDMSRGAAHWIEGPDEDAKALGLNPVSSGARPEDEGLFLVQHGYWKQQLQKGLDIEAVEEGGAAARPRRPPLTPARNSRGVDDMAISQSEVEQFLYREARYLDDREFDKWLACYAPAQRVLHAARGTTPLGDRSRARDFAHLLQQPWRAGGQGLPHQDGTIQRDQPSRTWWGHTSPMWLSSARTAT